MWIRAGLASNGNVSMTKTAVKDWAPSEVSILVKGVLKRGVNINSRDEYGKTALIAASQEGHEDIVKTLIDARADCNAIDGYRDTPLVWAAHNDHINGRGRTALMLAAVGGYIDIVKVLIEARADVNAQDRS